MFLGKRIPVLMYHQVSDSQTAPLNVLPRSFVRQMDWLEKKSFRFLSLDEVVDRGGKIPLWETAIALTFDDGYRDNYEAAFPLLLRRKRPAALFVVVDWVGKQDFVGWREIRELSQAGITIGSHSLTHRWLPRITDTPELKREVSDSKKIIENEIGKEVRHFCYPAGGVDERVAKEVKRAGYRAGWVAGARPTVRVKDRYFSIRRVKIGPSNGSGLRFALKAHGIRGLFENSSL